MAMVKRCVIFITICPFWSSYKLPQIFSYARKFTDILLVFHMCMVSTGLLPSDGVLNPGSAVEDKGKYNVS